MDNTDSLEQLKKLSRAERAFLAQRVRERKAALAAVETGIPRRDGSAPILLSSGQQRMWLAQQMDPESSDANVLVPLRLDGALDVRALGAGLTEVARRHEVLRTGIEAPNGEPVPAVLPPGPLPVPMIDLAGLPGPLAGEEGLRLAAAEAGWPFDLARPPVIRAQLARIAPGSHLLLLTLHHVAADGWSIAILVREMIALYGAFAAGLPSPLPELPLQYADYAAWQQGRMASGELAADLAYWRQRLDGLAPLGLLEDRERPAASAAHTVQPSVSLPAGSMERLRELAGQEKGTLFMAWAALFAAFLGRLADRDDVAFATPVAGRVRLETEGLIGFFVNTLVLRADLGGDPTLRQMTARLRTTIAEAHAHQEIPFERLVEELAPARRAGRHPLVQAMFAFQNAPREALSIPGLTVSPVEVKTGVALFDLALQVEPRGGELFAQLELDESLWGAAAAARLPRAFEALLAAAVADPDRPVGELPFLSAAERRQILAPAGPAVAPATPPPAALRIPAGELAGRVAAIWAEVLDLPEVGEHDSFWQLGGHSLLAARVAARVRQAFGVDLPLRVLFEASTPAELAAVLAKGGAGAPATASPVLRMDHDRDRPAPLSFGQQRLWFLHQLAPESAAYNIPLAVRMDGPLDARALAAALTRGGAAARGAADGLRHPPRGRPPRRSRHRRRCRCRRPICRRCRRRGGKREARRLAAEEARRPFDLTAAAAAARSCCVRLGEAAHLLAFDLHHIAGDGWSWRGPGARAGSALCAPSPRACPSPLPELPLQYADFAVWQRAELRRRDPGRASSPTGGGAWTASPPLALPTDRPRPPVAELPAARSRSRRLPARLTAGARAAGRRARGDPVHALLAAGFAGAARPLAGPGRLRSAPVAGRTRTELEALIGFFVNTLVLRADLAGDPSFAELLARSRETVLAAFSHQDLPFERLVEELGARRDPAAPAPLPRPCRAPEHARGSRSSSPGSP